MNKKIMAFGFGLILASGSLIGCTAKRPEAEASIQSQGAPAASDSAQSQGAPAASGNTQQASLDARQISGNLTLGTASSTGTFYYVGAAIGNAVSEAGKLNVLVQATNGSNENVAMCQSGDIDIGMANCDSLYAAYNGVMAYADAGSQDILEIAALYDSQLHVYVTEKSKITDISQLKGKKVCVGSQGTSYLLSTRRS